MGISGIYHGISYRFQSQVQNMNMNHDRFSTVICAIFSNNRHNSNIMKLSGRRLYMQIIVLASKYEYDRFSTIICVYYLQQQQASFKYYETQRKKAICRLQSQLQNMNMIGFPPLYVSMIFSNNWHHSNILKLSGKRLYVD